MAPDSIPNMIDPAVLELVLCLLDANSHHITQITNNDSQKNSMITDKIMIGPEHHEPAVMKSSPFIHTGTNYTPTWLTLTSTVDKTFSPALVSIPTERAINEIQLKHLLSEINANLIAPTQTQILIDHHPNINRRSFLGKIAPEMSYGSSAMKTDQHYKMNGAMYNDFKDSIDKSKKKNKISLSFSIPSERSNNSQRERIGVRRASFNETDPEYQSRCIPRHDADIRSDEERERERDKGFRFPSTSHDGTNLLLLQPTSTTPLPPRTADSYNRKGGYGDRESNWEGRVRDSGQEPFQGGSLAMSFRSMHSRPLVQRQHHHHNQQLQQEQEQKQQSIHSSQEEIDRQNNRSKERSVSPFFCKGGSVGRNTDANLYPDNFNRGDQSSNIDGIESSVTQIANLSLGSMKAVEFRSSGRRHSTIEPVLPSQVKWKIRFLF